MNWQTILYFISILLTCGLTGFLAWYAWRQPALPGVRAYAWLALSECLLALTDVISMLSNTQAQALFWFNLRFVFTGIIPVFWLMFALAYNEHKDWLSKRLLAGMFILPLITQIMLWSNGLHGLWVKQEVAFHQNGPFWIAETSARIPGVWFMVHSFYSLILLLSGIGVILFNAWHKRRLYRSQALLLTAGALVALITTLIPVFNLLPQAEFNLFIPGIGISALLYALAVFRFQFLKKSPAQESASRTTSLKAPEKGSLAVFFFIFILFASALAATAYVSYFNYEHQFRNQVESQLSAIADLKVSGLENWRTERMADADVLYNNPAFTVLVQRSLENTDDTQAGAQLQTWLDTVRNSYQYERVFLLDTGGVERVSSPATPEPVAEHLTQEAAGIINSGQVTFLDFHRDAPDETIHLALLVPVYAEQDRSRPLGLLVLRINPETYLYRYLSQWPISSKTAETLLVRREGEDALFLNPLRFKRDAALNLRIPLENTETLAVKAALGQTGSVEGLDYRGVAVVGHVRAVPDSPWFLVARMDTAEVYAPLRERLWQTVLFFSVLIAAAGTGLALVWRQQRLRYYRGQVEMMDALHDSQAQVIGIVNSAMDAIITVDEEQKIIIFNPSAEQMFGCLASQAIGQTLDRFIPESFRKEHNKHLRVFGQSNSTKRSMKSPALALTCLRANGEVFPSEVSISQLEIGGQKLYTAIVRDITEHKQTEEKILASEVRYRRLFEAARDGILILDAETGMVMDVNPFMIDMLGFSREAFLGKNLWDLGFFKDIAANKANFLELQQEEYIRYEDLPLETAYDRRIQVEFVSNVYQVDHQRVMQCNIREITERKQAEQILRESERKLREAQEMAHLGFWLWDIKTGHVEWSEEVFKIFGLDPKEFTPRIDSILAMSPWDEDHQRDKELINRAIESHSPGSYEQRFLRPDQSIGHYYSTFQGNYDKNGDLISIVGTVLDITERKQAEEKVLASEVRYRRLFEAARDGILILNAETGVVTDVNPFLLEMLGFSQEKILGKELWELGFFKDIATSKANFLELQQKKYIRYEDLPLETADGRRFYVEFVSNVYQVNHHKVIQCNIRDITERKRAEDALRESEDKFKYVFEHSMVGKSITQINGGMQVNKALCDMLGYSPQEMQAKKWQEITHPDDIELTQNQINLLTSGENESVQFVKRFIHKNGAIVWVDLNSTIRRDGQHKPLYLMSAVIDITERKRVEEEIRVLNTELEQRVVERTVQLEVANKELEAFAYSVSHDLRAPLRGIDGFSQILLNKFSGQLGKDGEHYLVRVRENTKRMSQLIDDLLILSRISRQEMSQQPVDLMALANEVAAMLAETDPQRQVRFKIAEQAIVEGDAGLLKVVLQNLLGNAWKFTGPRELAEIEVGFLPHPLPASPDGSPTGMLREGAGGEGRVFYVRDNGVGFDMQYADKLFGAFQRLHSTQEFPGTGIGLATVQRVIHRHGGRVWAEAAVDKGATFYFTLGETS